ncbi:reverse transcriptase domain-containing protein [Tanacetum coccineum]
MTNTRSGMTPATIEEMINQRVDATLETRRVNRDLELGNGNDNGNGNGTGNGNNRGNNGDGNENRNVNGRGDRPVAHECTYQDFMKCQPLGFKGTKGVVGLIRWSEKMETVFHISNCPERYQVKYATYTLLDSALTWWNSHKRTIRTDAAYALSWRELLKLVTEVYCLRNKIQKMETELWNLSVKNNDMATYTQRFQELTMMCTKMVPEEEDRVEKFIGGLPDNIQGNVIAAEPTRLQDAVRIANNLMDQKLKGYAVRNAENKRRLNNNYRNNRGQQPPHKRQNTGGQNVARAYMAGNNEKNGYEGTLPFCNKELGFKGTEGVVGLIRWSEKMETVFHISNCPERYQVKYATCTLLDSALTWWNSHKRTIGTDAAYALSWRELLKLMTEVYCPRNEIQKMETELWNLSVKNNDMTTYT